MELIIKEESNGNKLSLEIVNNKMRVCVYDNEIGMSVDLNTDELNQFKRVLDKLSSVPQANEL